MTEPDFGACEVRFLLPDIRLERSECTARTGSPFSTSYLGDAGRCDLRVRHRKPGNARTEKKTGALVYLLLIK